MHERGQASVEWIGVVALIAVVMAAVLVLALPGAGIAGAFVRQFHRALCIVSRGVCDLDRRTCPVASHAIHDGWHVNIAVARFGHDEAFVIQKDSDGSVLVTHVSDWSGGFDVGVGVDGSVNVAGVDLAASASARAAIMGGLGNGDSWRFANARDAELGMAQLSEGHDPDAGVGYPVADIKKRRIGSFDLDAKASLGKLEAALGIAGSQVQGVAIDPIDERRTYVIERAGDAELVIKGGSSSAAGSAAGKEQIEVTAGADGEPVELTISRSGQLDGRLSLPDVAQGAAARVLGGTAGARGWVVVERLDLTDPRSRAIAHDYLSHVFDGLSGQIGRDTEALRRRVEEVGVTEVRAYALTNKDNGNLSAHAAAGMKFGFGIGETTQDLRLLDARIRSVDGQWRTRDDCLAAA
jgi:hypothetical protein